MRALVCCDREVGSDASSLLRLVWRRFSAAEAGADFPSLEIFEDGSVTMQSELSVAGSATLLGGLTLKPSAGARKLSGSGSSSGADSGFDSQSSPPVALLIVEASNGAWYCGLC